MKKRNAKVRAGRLEIDGKPQFLYSGEIHYFRIEPNEWRDRLIKAKSLGLNTVSTYIPWRWHEIESPHDGNPPQFDFTGTTDSRRNLIRFIEETEKCKLDLILRLGPISNGEMRFEGLPDRIAKDPRTVESPESALHHTTAPNYLATAFLKPALEWLNSLLPIVVKYQSTNGGPVTMVQLDNEIGMVHWIGGLTLNSRVFAEYFRRLKRDAVSAGIKVPFIANIPQFYDYDTRSRGNWAPVTALNFEEFESAGVEIMGGAYQPRRLDADNCHDIHLATEVVRSIQKNSIAICAETQTGILVDRPRLYPKDVHLLLSIASMTQLRGLNLYMLAGGENPDDLGAFGIEHDWQAPISPSGKIRAHAEPIKEFGAKLKKLEPFFASGESWTPVDIAVPEEYYRGQNNPFFAESLPCFFDAAARSLFLEGFPPRWIWIGRKKNPRLQERQFKSRVVFAFSLGKMSAESQKKILSLIRNGKTVVISPKLPDKDLEGRPCRILADALKAESISIESDRTTSKIFGETIFNMTKPAPVKVESAEIFGEWAGNTIAFEKQIGKGKAIYIGVSLSDRQNSQERVFKKLLIRLKLQPLLSFRSENIEKPICMVKRLKKDYLVLIANMHETNWSGEIILKERNMKETIAGRCARFYIYRGGRLWRT